MRQLQRVPLSELSWLQKSSLLQHFTPVSLHCIGKSNSGRKKLFLSIQLHVKWKKLISFSDHYSLFQRISSRELREKLNSRTILIWHFTHALWKIGFLSSLLISHEKKHIPSVSQTKFVSTQSLQWHFNSSKRKWKVWGWDRIQLNE